MGVSDFGFRISDCCKRLPGTCARRHAMRASKGTCGECSPRNPKSEIRNPKSHAAFSLIELLIALVITSMLLTATMVAIDASFQAYAAAAESASTQTTTRLVTHRLLALVRTSTAHGPLLPEAAYVDGAGTSWPAVALDGDTISSHYLELIDSKGDLIHIEYRADDEELWVQRTPFNGVAQPAQPLMGGVKSATFFAKRRYDADGVLVLERASIDLTVEADDDNSLELENSSNTRIRVIASTMPRRLD